MMKKLKDTSMSEHVPRRTSPAVLLCGNLRIFFWKYGRVIVTMMKTLALYICMSRFKNQDNLTSTKQVRSTLLPTVAANLILLGVLL
jgi:hypothetical protein